MLDYVTIVLKFLGSNAIALGIVSVCSFLSFVLTIIVSLRTAKISRIIRFNNAVSEYNNKKREFQNTFEGHRMSIQVDGNHTDKLLKDILKNLEEYDSQFREILPVRIRFTIWAFIAIVRIIGSNRMKQTSAENP